MSAQTPHRPLTAIEVPAARRVRMPDDGRAPGPVRLPAPYWRLREPTWKMAETATSVRQPRCRDHDRERRAALVGARRSRTHEFACRSLALRICRRYRPG